MSTDDMVHLAGHGISGRRIIGISEWVNAVEASSLLGIHVNTLKRLPPEELPFFRIGTRGDRRYRYSDIEDYIESRMVYYKAPVVPKVKRV